MQDSTAEIEVPSVAPCLNPARAGRHVRIRPVLPGDHKWLHELAVMTEQGARWRLQGTVPSFEQFLQVLYAGTHANFALERARDGAAYGLCQLWQFDPLARTAHLTTMLAPGFVRKAWPMEGIFLFIDYVFSCYGLRKLYLESLEDEAKQYAIGSRSLLVLEGKLKGHKFVHGRYVDNLIFALWRETFVAHRDHFLPVVTPLLPPESNEMI